MEDYSLFESLRQKAIEDKIPLIAHIDLTYQCNVRCSHCYVIPENRQELTTSEVINLLEQLAKLGTLYLTLSGGEIFIRKDLINIAECARKLHFSVRLLTNGLLISEEIADKIASLYIEMIAISIYSMDPETHDKITGLPGSLEKSISAIMRLKDKGVRIKISTVIMRSNYGDWKDIGCFAKSIGGIFQADFRIAPRSDGNTQPLEFGISKEQMIEILSDPEFINREDYDFDETYEGAFITIPCGAAHMSCYINPYGDICPCVQLPIRCGGVRTSSFENVWKHSSQMLGVRSITLQKMEKCSTCDLLTYCRPCMGLNLAETGSIFVAPSRVCQESKIMRGLKIKRR